MKMHKFKVGAVFVFGFCLGDVSGAMKVDEKVPKDAKESPMYGPPARRSHPACHKACVFWLRSRMAPEAGGAADTHGGPGPSIFDGKSRPQLSARQKVGRALTTC